MIECKIPNHNNVEVERILENNDFNPDLPYEKFQSKNGPYDVYQQKTGDEWIVELFDRINELENRVLDLERR